ncbi:helix-turn-helix transcriptional regulator [Streptomyces sp. UNOB3_S3]|uniref:helix-turn-helix domain-containing protein n=1 Tax=Streptomyces sp. UNOB3_S3 TaxID=2871682 RepID=UPI001E3622D6|nr:helix-turn-helix transcriptional regulator [Streptomyces sp. UNOB3_S3]MCC3779425.1 helix-turn-helix domain-containing protein [Streptomyces sp. UNOB3_S3]
MTFEPEQLGRSRQELAASLKGLRKRSGLSGDRVARRMNVSQSKVSRIENGKVRPSIVDVEHYLRAVDAPADLVTDVMALARITNTEWQDFRNLRRKGLDKKQQELAALEKSSTEFRFFLLSMITGLLSTPDYIRASLAHVPGDHNRTVTRKLERQEVLYDTTKRFTFLLSELALKWPLVPAPAMAMQLDRLVSVSRLPSVRLGVIPAQGHMPVAPMDTFTVYDTNLATAETTTGVVILRDPRDVAAYLELFSILESYALFDNDARGYLTEHADKIRDL